MQKTVAIWNTFDGPVKFISLNGDQRHFDQVFINDGNEETFARQEELGGIVYNDEDGYINKDIEITKEQFIQEIQQGAFLIECGFIP